MRQTGRPGRNSRGSSRPRRGPWLAAALAGAPLALALPPGASASPASVGARDDLVQRRAIRGESLAKPTESLELRQLREFEEEAFPDGTTFVPAPGEVAAEEGAAPAGPPPRPSTVTPPPGLRSPALHALLGDDGPRDGGGGIGADDRDGAPRTALPWLAGLRLPDVPVRFDPRVVRYLEFYKNDPRGRSIMASWLRAQGRYRTLIEDALRRARLPQALLYVCMIESGYDPHDHSHAGAVGLWQFMPEGGRIYGLRIDHWVDERKDPERATEAAMRYLGDLKARFGSWHLALAAFNHGYGGVLRAVAKYNSNDYWELARLEDGLPWETVLYVPKWLAAATVGVNREVFGYGDVVPDPPFAYDRVLVTTSTSLSAIAAAAGVRVEEVAALNPELRRGRTPPPGASDEPGGGWPVRLPRGAGPRFLASFERHREPVATHVVRFGERLETIAAAAGASARELRRMNGIGDLAEVRPGLTLVVPTGRTPIALPGEDDPVIVAVPDRERAEPGRQRVFYRVLPGDTVRDVASFFRVSAGDLSRWNRLDLDARLSSRMVLQVWVARDFDTAAAALLDPARVRLVTVGSEEFFDAVEGRRGRKRVVHKVKAGETLKSIARRYHLTEADLERINRFGRKSGISVGQPVMVYVAMSAAEKAEAEERLRAAIAASAMGTPRAAGVSALAATVTASVALPPLLGILHTSPIGEPQALAARPATARGGVGGGDDLGDDAKVSQREGNLDDDRRPGDRRGPGVLDRADGDDDGEGAGEGQGDRHGADDGDGDGDGGGRRGAPHVTGSPARDRGAGDDAVDDVDADRAAAGDEEADVATRKSAPRTAGAGS